MTAMVIGMDHTWLFVDPADLPIWPPVQGPDASREEWEVAVAYLEDSAAEAGTVNISTPLDMARYQLAVINDTLISPWVSQQVATILQQQALRDGFPYYLDGDYVTFSKPGNLEDAVNDVGAIFLPDGPRAVAMMSLEVPDVWWATLVQRRLALIATGEDEIPAMSW
jgi:CubicO group peptidase (beta-lactamase class C family)